MILKEAVARFDLLYPNSFSYKDKVNMLSELDGRLINDLKGTYKEAEKINFSPYSVERNLDTRLFVPFPHDDIYIKYLAMQCDRINSDIGRYNNSVSVFNSSYMDFINSYNRENTAKDIKIRF